MLPPRRRRFVFSPIIFFAAGLFCQGTGIVSLQADTSLFGNTTESREALIGILYDFKQSQDSRPTDITPGNYFDLLDRFMASGWDENVFHPYYRATKAVHATQLMIPTMAANSAPKAFGVEDFVEPRLWMVHYKGQVLPPHAGKFRFAGYADDFMAVAVNGETVLVSGWLKPQIFKMTNWQHNDEMGMKAANGQLRYSNWIEFDGTTPIDLDLLVGERPGGIFAALLYWQEEGQTYTESSDRTGHILPPLQFASGPIPDRIVYAEGFPLWKVVP